MEIEEIIAIEEFRDKFLEKFDKSLPEHLLWNRDEIERKIRTLVSETLIEMLRES